MMLKLLELYDSKEIYDRRLLLFLLTFSTSSRDSFFFGSLGPYRPKPIWVEDLSFWRVEVFRFFGSKPSSPS